MHPICGSTRGFGLFSLNLPVNTMQISSRVHDLLIVLFYTTGLNSITSYNVVLHTLLF